MIYIKTIFSIKKLAYSAIVFSLLLTVHNTSYSQGRDRSKFRVSIDTGLVPIDTTGILDTTQVRGPVDSTARIKNFKYEREDKPVTSLGESIHPLLLGRSSAIEYKLSFDSLNNIIITEIFEGEQIKVPLVISLDKYIETRTRIEHRNQLYGILAEFYKIETEDDLAKLFKNITEITIPLPFTSETIFGPPTINLKINGVIDITASYQKTVSDQQTITQTSNEQNNINFKQEVQVTTKGSVGDKLTIDADWNSQRTFDFENQLKLKYKGYPDEVIQGLEAGNVSLETKSNLIGGTQSLFGVKAQFKLGPLSLTAIASQKKSEKKEVNITGGTVETPFNIPIWDYSENNYLLDESYESSFVRYFQNAPSTGINITRLEVWVVSTVNNPKRRSVIAFDTLGNRPQNGYIGLDTIQQGVDGKILLGNFYKLETSEYTLNQYAGYITINGNLQATGSDAIAVAYSVDSGGVTKFIGDFSEQATQGRIKLKLLRTNGQQSPSQNPDHATLWKRMLKNIYNLGVRNLNNDPSSIPEFNIYYNIPGQPQQKNYTGNTKPGYPDITGRNYMNLTKIDYRVNGDPTPVPNGDDKFDFVPGNTIDLINGNIIFPTMRPFSWTLDSVGVDTSYTGNNDSIYTTSKTIVQQYSDIKFSIVGKAKGEASSRYSLGFNVVEGSVKVFNGTVELQNGVDYTIDYSLGELIITNAAVLVTGSNIKITYESNDLFQLASKTLLGTRAELTLNKSSYIGFTLINLKQQTLNDKVRIGEEPTNNTIMGFDASTDIKTNFLTKLINKIPGYYTKEESILNLKGEVAFMLPDPNTKKSVIPGDNNEAVAYIDDFEGIKKLVPLNLNPLTWTLSSVPIDEQLVSINNPDRDSLTGVYRSKLTWFSDLNSVPIKTVYPNKSIATNQNQNLSPLTFDIKPDSVGQYNYITQTAFKTNGLTSDKWSGVFKYLNTSQSNFVDENINYIEIWMKVSRVDSNTSFVGDSAKMLIDIGQVTEKIITATKLFPPKPQGSQTINFHTEDENGSGTLDIKEDVGLDGYSSIITDENPINEELQALTSKGIQIDNTSDPSRDDYDWTQSSVNYSSFNGTEGNATQLTEAKRIDTEDLNNNGTLDEVNKYYEYEIPLTNLKIGEHPFITGGGEDGWFQFIVPLDEFKRAYGDPTLTYVQYVRVWFKGFENNARIRIVDFNLVGNQWVKLEKKDTTYTTSLVNIEDNSSIYQSPVPGDVLRQKDPNQPEQNVLSNEQSLSLDVTSVLPGQSKLVFKSFVTRPYDLINYKILKLFVNGDPSFTYNGPNDYDATVIVRLGLDTSNYYEYRAPIHPDERPASPWYPLNEVVINLTELTAVKEKQDSTGNLVYQDVPNGPPGSKYGVKGHPSIRDIKQITLGVYNNNTNPIIAPALTGSVWFNEMRVLKTNDDNGYAFNISAGLKLADLGTFNFTYSKSDPNFHNLEGRFGTLNLANAWEISGTVNFHKLLNALLSRYISVKLKNFFTIPISFAHTEALDKPDYQPNTDVNVETAAQNKYDEIIDKGGTTQQAQNEANQLRINSQTLRIVNRFSITGMKFNFPVDNFFVREILNKLEINFTRNTYTERTPTLESKYAWDMNGGLGLASTLNLVDNIHLKIGKWLPMGEEFRDAKIYFFFPFLPLTPFFSTTMGAGANFTRNRGDEKLRTNTNQSPTSRNFGATRSFSLDWKFIENWMINIDGNYSFSSGSDLTFLETSNDSLKNQRSEGDILDDIFFTSDGIVNWGKDLDFSQNVSINPKFNIPVLRNFVDLTASYRVQYGWRRSEFNEAFGSTVGYSADVQSTAFIKLNEIFNIFKPKDNEKIRSGAPSPYQDDQQSAGDILKLLRSLIPDQVTVNYSQTKQLTNPGVNGLPGLANFWINFNTNEDNGPSRIYQLGWQTDPGNRVPNLQFTDLHNLNNILTLNSFITPIFPNNLKINFTFKTSISKNKQLSYVTDTVGFMGQPVATNESRSFTRPSFFVTGDIIDKIGVPENSATQAQFISDAFENNFVSFPFPSWTLNLTGVEKFDLFSGFAQTMTIESGYNTEYKKVFTYDGRNPELVSSLALLSSFSPLIGVNINFKPISGGTLTASFKLGSSNNYNIEPNNTARITNTASSDLSINASYTKSGFKIPLFGLALDNNITIGFSFTRTKNEPVVYELNILQGLWSQNAQSGSTITTTLNPSIQYNLSSSVVLQLFYKYNKIEPIGGNLNISTRTSNEAGLNVKLQIQ